MKTTSYLSKVFLSLVLLCSSFHGPQALATFRADYPGGTPEIADQYFYHTTDVQREAEQFTEELVRNPDDHEVSLTLSERWMLSKIILGLIARGALFELKQLLGKVVTLDSNLGNNMKDLSEEKLQRYEMNILLFFKRLQDRGVLRPYLWTKLHQVEKLPILGGKVKGLGQEKQERAIVFIAGNLEGAIFAKGLGKDNNGLHYVEWVDVSRRYSEMIAKTQFSEYEIEGIGSAEEVRPLVDGEASFALRSRLMDQARKSIDILVWAVYDDTTGEWLVNKIRQKVRQGVAIRLIVDGQVAARPGYHSRVDDIERMGVPVIRWVSPQAPFVGQHRKIMIIDGVHVIAGGLNFGDEYSHMNPKASPWRDTDIYVRGRFGAEVAQKYFDQFWNEAVTEMKLPMAKSPLRLIDISKYRNNKKVTFLNHDPVKYAEEGSPIYRAIMNDIRLAQKSIDIENAYIVVIPSFVEAIRQAVQRGVRVRIFTNSSQSVDEPSIGEAMMITAQKLMDAGAEIYLRKGSTLHSKFLVVDEERSYVMSYNFHPRSEKMEGEMAFPLDDAEFGRTMDQVFEKDIGDSSSAYRVTDRKQLDVEMSLKLWVILRLMYDQL
jgi:phosphatidylserine/phosphatidylglycerophosphate/cardiolipin synthase-like enzyme